MEYKMTGNATIGTCEVQDNDARMVLGVSPDAITITGDNGGKQSATPYAFHLLPINALLDIAKLAKDGAEKYGETFENRNYKKISVEDHINHAVVHLMAWLAGDRLDDHLTHAALRCMFAKELEDEKEAYGNAHQFK